MIYTYLVKLEKGDEYSRGIYTMNGEITKEGILKIEKDQNAIVTSVSLLNRKWSNPSESSGGQFIVRNVDYGQDLHFTFRSEALDYFEHVVSEKGQGSEIELLLRIRHHVPSEISQ